MYNKLIITFLIVLAALSVQGKGKTIVWENPTTEYGSNYGDGFFNTALDVTKVELKSDETVVYITVMLWSDYPDYTFQFVSDTYLKAGDKRYALVSADGIELNKFVQTGKDYRSDIVFHFQPLPMNTKTFDFIEGDGDRAFQLKGIKPVEERWKQMLPSYWRDEKTGDWKIAFLEQCAIYQCKFWDYKQRNVNPKTGEAEFLLSNGNREIKVTVGKDQKGRRAMRIDGEDVVYSMITSRFLPDYPTKDTRTDFVNTGYKADNITVVGWVKDVPQWMDMKTFEFSFYNILTDEEESLYADLDEMGRFSMTIPILNSSEFFCGWNYCYVNTVLEPGKTYFMLYDFKEGRRYFMGDDCRLQNELFKYPLGWSKLHFVRGNDPDQYIASVDRILNAHNASIDQLCNEHPTLSARFAKYKKDNMLWLYAYDVSKMQFYCPNFEMPENALRYAHDRFWTQLESPYTMHRDLNGFLRNYIDILIEENEGQSLSFDVRDHLDEIEWDDKEKATLDNYYKWLDDYQPRLQAASTPEEKRRLWQTDSTKNADLLNQFFKIIQGPKVNKLVKEYFLLSEMQDTKRLLDSLNVDQIVCDKTYSKFVCDMFARDRTSINPRFLDTLRAWVSTPSCIERVEKLNDRYIAIEKRDFDKLVIKSSDNLQGMSDGEALLRKLVEPYKGKFVLLDIWGTWCGPCKEALSHSTEEYARLSDFDIEYLYLANSSPQDSWENVIKEYNVSGDNVAHYNLPREQQDAIERYLNVNAFPTYKLFDRDGNLLDLDVDPRDLEDLANLLEQLSE